MPITIFDTGIPATRRDPIETAVVAGRRNVTAPHEAWIAADPLRGGFKALVTGRMALSTQSTSIRTRSRASSRRMSESH